MPDEKFEFEHPMNLRSEAHPTEKKEVEQPEVEIVPNEDVLPDIRTPEAKAEDEDAGDKRKTKDEDEEVDDLPQSVQKRINKEVWKRHEAERLRQADLARIQELENQLKSVQQRAEFSDTHALTSREEQIKAMKAAVQREYLAAANDADSERMFEATQRLAQLAADEKELEIVKRNRERETALAKARQPEGGEEQQQRQQQQRQQPQADPLAMEWASDNPWFGRDRVMTAVAFSIDQELKEEGVPPGSRKFYQELDKRLREELPHKFPEGTQRRHVAQPVAGASRAPAKAGGLPKLTEREAETARRLGVPLAEYARFVQR